MKTQETITDVKQLPTEILLSLIDQAKKRFTLLFPVDTKQFLFDCFTIEVLKGETFLYFWYNDIFNSTHAENIKIN